MAGRNNSATRRDKLLTANQPTDKRYLVKPGRIVRYSRSDATRSYVTDSPTATKFVSLLKSVDTGSVFAMSQLYEEMASKDAHFQGVASTRLNAVTALDWEIIPAQTSEANQGLADAAADFVREELTNLQTFPDTLVHLQDAICTGIAVTELVWKDLRLVETIDVPGEKLEQDLSTGRFVVTTERKPLGVNTPEGKFVVYTPRPRAGFPLRVTPVRAQAWLYLIKHFILADWAGFCERFGMPIPVATFTDEVEDDVKDDLERMLQNVAANGYAMLPDGTTLNLLEAGRGTQPFKELIELVDRKTSILFLGQTLTTEMQGTGSWAAATVHNNVRTDILLADLKNEARTIRRSVIGPMCWCRFPNKEAPLPYFRRVLYESRNVESEKLNLEQVRAAREFGLPVGEDELYEMLGVSKPIGEAKVIRPPQSAAAGSELPEEQMSTYSDVTELIGILDQAISVGDEEVVNVVRNQIGSCLNVELKPVKLRGSSRLDVVEKEVQDPLQHCRERWGRKGDDSDSAE